MRFERRSIQEGSSFRQLLNTSSVWRVCKLLNESGSCSSCKHTSPIRENSLWTCNPFMIWKEQTLIITGSCLWKSLQLFYNFPDPILRSDITQISHNNDKIILSECKVWPEEIRTYLDNGRLWDNIYSYRIHTVWLKATHFTSTWNYLVVVKPEIFKGWEVSNVVWQISEVVLGQLTHFQTPQAAEGWGKLMKLILTCEGFLV